MCKEQIIHLTYIVYVLSQNLKSCECTTFKSSKNTKNKILNWNWNPTRSSSLSSETPLHRHDPLQYWFILSSKGGNKDWFNLMMFSLENWGIKTTQNINKNVLKIKPIYILQNNCVQAATKLQFCIMQNDVQNHSLNAIHTLVYVYCLYLCEHVITITSMLASLRGRFMSPLCFGQKMNKQTKK